MFSGRIPASKSLRATSDVEGPNCEPRKNVGREPGTQVLVRDLDRGDRSCMVHPVRGRSRLGRLGQDELQLEARGEISRYPRDAHGVGPVGLDGDVEDRVASNAEGICNRGAGGGHLFDCRKYEQPGSVV